MMVSSLFLRQGLKLLATCTLLVSCFLLSGCGALTKWWHPEAYLQRPALLILVDPHDVKNGKVDYKTDAKEIEISGVRVGKLLEKAISWRVNLFLDGNRVSGSDEFNNNMNIELPGTPVEQLMRGDVDLHLRGTLGKEDAEFRSESFMILFHQHPLPKQLR